jgi:hypothetical protein
MSIDAPKNMVSWNMILNPKVIKQLGRYFLMSHHHQIPRKSMKPVNHDPQTLTTTSFSTISAQSRPKAKLRTASGCTPLALTPHLARPNSNKAFA